MDKEIASCLGWFCVCALVTFGETVAIVCKHLVVWQYVFLGHIHFRGMFLLFELVSLSIFWHSTALALFQPQPLKSCFYLHCPPVSFIPVFSFPDRFQAR